MSLLLAKKRSHTLLSALFVLTAVCYVLISLVNLFKRKKDPDHPEK